VELLQSLQRLAGCQELHADHIEQILSLFTVQQRRVRQQRPGLAFDPLQGLAQRVSSSRSSLTR